MIRTTSIVCCAISLMISLLLPPVFAAVYAIKRRKQGIISAWLLGAVGFVVPQLLIRLPLLQMLGANAGFVAFAESHLALYGLGLAFTAGLFELAGRFAAAALMRKKLTCRRALAAGLGHGGIEAMVLVGLSMVNNLVLMLLLRSGGADAVLSQLAAGGADAAQLQAILTTLTDTAPAMFLLAGFERLLAMTGHLAMSMLVCYGVRTGRALRCGLICLAMHTLMDSVACISMLIGRGLSQAVAYSIIYAVLTVMGVLSIRIVQQLFRRWPEEAVQEAAE